MKGTLWRDVVNFLGDEDITPYNYLPLIEMVAEHRSNDGHFLQQLANSLTDSKTRAALDRDLRYAYIGHQIITNHRETLLQWAGDAKDGPHDEDFVENWWWDIEKGVTVDNLDTHAMDHGEELFTRLQIDPVDKAFIQADGAKLQQRKYYLLISWLRRHHHWSIELDILRDLAYKTWPADSEGRQLWNAGELGVMEEYYSEQQPALAHEGNANEGIDPFAIRPVNHEQGLAIGMGKLGYCMYIILRSTYIDFMDEILEHSRFPQARGSLRCIECGIFVGRRALGYGQLYCGDACKKRAAKRRYRSSRSVHQKQSSRRIRHLRG